MDSVLTHEVPRMTNINFLNNKINTALEWALLVEGCGFSNKSMTEFGSTLKCSPPKLYPERN